VYVADDDVILEERKCTMKSFVSYLQGLYSAYLSDIAVRIPPLRVDSERDASRLLSLVRSRGLSFLMIDLPTAGKHFDRALSSGHLSSFCIAGFRPYKRGTSVPRLFKGLMLRVFDENGVLRSDPDITSISLLRQLFYGAKKVEVACSDSRTWEHVHEFFQTDRGVRLPSLNWDEDLLRTDNLPRLHFGDVDVTVPVPLLDLIGDDDQDEVPPAIDPALYDATQSVADIVASSLGVFEGSEWRAKHGPGAVSDQHHTFFKYDFPSWPDKLGSVFPMAEFAFANLASWADFANNEGSSDLFSSHEFPSKLIAVPKTLKGPRLIASEPVAHQWCQQMIKDYFVDRLASTPIASSIHFRDQTFNQEAARLASHNQTHVTVDLSSASDRISCWSVERLFRRLPSLVSALHASRTRWISNEIDKCSPRFHKLRKFSCMGSACTFPVQTYLFTVLAISSVLYSRGWKYTIHNIRRVSKEVLVFGDDIIVPVDGWDALQGLLGGLGLEINQQKTYGSGSFRESCGLDAFDGNDVTPTYSITYPEVSRPESIASCVETHNNFFAKGLWATAEFVKSKVASLRRFRLMNVPVGSGAFGFTSYYCDNDHLRSRYNRDLQRMEYRADVLSSTTKRVLPKSDSLLLQYFTVARVAPLFLEGDRLGIAKRARTNLRPRWVVLA